MFAIIANENNQNEERKTKTMKIAKTILKTNWERYVILW